MLKNLRGKLIALFALLVISGGAVTLIVTTLNTRNQFNRYVAASDLRRAATLADILSSYYETNGGWRGVDRLLEPRLLGQARGSMGQMMSSMMPRGDAPAGGPASGQFRNRLYGPGTGGPAAPIGPPGAGGSPELPGPPNRPGFERIVLAGADGAIIVDTNQGAGAPPSPAEIRRGYPVTVNGSVVGRVMVGSMADSSFSPQERGFLQSVGLGVIISSITVALLATILGALFLSGITRPLRLLTRAATGMAAGRRNVPIPRISDDEIGRLAASFGNMQLTIEREEQARQKLFRDIAHELRTPVTLIQGELEAMIDGVYKSDEAGLRSLLEEARFLSRLIGDVQLLAALDAEELNFTPELTSAEDLLQQAVRKFQAAFDARGIRAVINVETDLPELEIDRARIVQVLDNLMTNAIVHGGEVHTITVAAERVDGTSDTPAAVAIRVSDDGRGIAAEEMDRIFERLYRVEDGKGGQPKESGRPGSGLGLAISRRIVEAHGGKISVESQAGAGTTFTILLPLRRQGRMA